MKRNQLCLGCNLHYLGCNLFIWAAMCALYYVVFELRGAVVCYVAGPKKILWANTKMG